MTAVKGPAEHTGGDWQIIKQNHDSHVVIESGEVNIAAVMLGDCPDGSTGEANARLIAAAPALLAACKRAKRTITYLMSAAPLSDITDQERQDYKSIQSAISQAGEGGE